MVAINPSTREKKRACPALLPELVFSVHMDSARDDGHSNKLDRVNGVPNNWEKVRVHIEQPSTGRFFVVGYREYLFLSLLDGETSFAHTLASVAQKLGAHSLKEDQAQQLVRWAQDNLLLRNEQVDRPIDSKTSGSAKKRKWERATWNPIWIKLPLTNPDRFLTLAHQLLRWLFQPWLLCLSIVLLVYACFQLIANVDSFVSDSSGILNPNNWIWMAFSWLLLKCLHEFAHGLVCKHFGGEVREVGVLMVLFAPIAYCDVNSSWSFPSRLQRMAVAAAGIWAELLVSAVCVLLWQSTDAAFARQILVNTIIMASLSTLLFNANPLMRFDGYYLLADLLGRPNLYSLASARATRLCRWAFFGHDRTANSWEDTRHPVLLTAYGFACAIWKLGVGIALLVAAFALFGQLGLTFVVATAAVATWQFLYKCVWSEVSRAARSRPAVLLRFTLVCTILFAGTGFLWFFCPSPVQQTSPCIVTFQEATQLHAETNGFVSEILVQSGDHISQGQPLLRLESFELAADIAQVQAELRAEMASERLASQKNLASATQVAWRNQQALRSRLADLLRQEEALVVTSPREGLILNSQLEQLPGQFVKRGDWIALIAPVNGKEIHLSLRTEDQGFANDNIGREILVRLGSRRPFSAKLKQVAPTASLEIRNVALSATNGGPLAVQSVDSLGADGPNSKYELVEPRFHAVATIDPYQASRLFSGERGYAMLGRNGWTAGQWLFFGGRDWIQRKLREAQAVNPQRLRRLLSKAKILSVKSHDREALLLINFQRAVGNLWHNQLAIGNLEIV